MSHLDLATHGIVFEDGQVLGRIFDGDHLVKIVVGVHSGSGPGIGHGFAAAKFVVGEGGFGQQLAVGIKLRGGD